MALTSTNNGGKLHSITSLDRVAGFIQRFAVLSPAQLVVVALWVAHTHALDAADTTAYLSITSAEKQCGKTRLLEVLTLLVARPWLTGSVSKAVLVRKLDAQQPTLLLDESDAAFAGDREYSEALRAVLNFGHSRDGVASLCVGQGTNIEFKDFHVFGAKAIAGIGKPPDTVADRAVPIRMKRRAQNENVERFRRRLLSAEVTEIQNQLVNWLTPELESLRNASPGLPDVLSDRQQDGCEPLLAIADLAGGEWPLMARNALVELLTGEAADDGSVGVNLLADIRTVFEETESDRIATAVLLNALCDLNPQWFEFSHSKPISAASLSRLFKRYAIHHRKLRLDGKTLWGYLRESFDDAFLRYLPRNLEHLEQHNSGADATQSSTPEQPTVVPACETIKSKLNTRVVPSVPDNGRREPRPCFTHGAHSDWWERPPAGCGEWVCARCHPKIPSAEELGFGSRSY